MRNVLIGLFAAMLIAMLGVTVYASLDRGMLDAGGELMEYPWFIATLTDAYLAFLAFYVWVAWRQRGMVSRIVWFVLIMCLGSMAIAAYMLWQLWRIRGQSIDQLWMPDRVADPAT